MSKENFIWRKNVGKSCPDDKYLLVGRDLSCDSFSRPILSFKPNFKSGIPDRKHFIRIFPVTSQRRTTPKTIKQLAGNLVNSNMQSKDMITTHLLTT